jgi:hypothetical protein
VRILEIEAVVLTIQVRWHGADKPAIKLFAICLTEFDPGDFRYRVPLVRRFERAGEQILFFQGLWRELRINAGAAEEQQFFHPDAMGAVDEIRFNH